jgi:HD-like signal output (HDOD) protein
VYRRHSDRVSDFTWGSSQIQVPPEAADGISKMHPNRQGLGVASGHGALVLQDRVALAHLIDQKLELPSVPSMAMRVLQVAQDDRSSVQDLAKLIEADPNLATWLLRIANSAFYGCSRFVASVPQAIRLVGNAEVKNLAIAVASRKLYARSGPVERALWQTAVGSAVATHLLARTYAPEVRDNAFLAGQLHDVGRVLMYAASPEAYAASEVVAKEYGLPAAERALYGFAHTDVGALIMNRWKLPEILETIAGAHHSFLPDESMSSRAPRLNACVIVADFLCYRGNIGTAPGIEAMDRVLDKALDLLAIPKDRLDEVQVAFNGALVDARALFS